MVTIEEVKKVDARSSRPSALPQLSSSNPPPTEAELASIVTSRASVLLIARDPAQDGAIVGSLTLVLFRIPTGLRAWIETWSSTAQAGMGVAVAQPPRSTREQAGAKTVDLTCDKCAGRQPALPAPRVREAHERVYRYEPARGSIPAKSGRELTANLTRLTGSRRRPGPAARGGGAVAYAVRPSSWSSSTGQGDRVDGLRRRPANRRGRSSGSRRTAPASPPPCGC
jgi:hypothetical protein